MTIDGSTWIAVAAGATAGAVLALVTAASGTPAPRPARPPAVVASPSGGASLPLSVAGSALPSAGAVLPQAEAGVASPPAPAKLDRGADSGPSHTAVNGSSSRSPHEWPLGAVEEVVPTAVRCTEGDPDACVRLADAYEKGTVVATNAREAKRYRRIALTLYVSQCQRRSALACHRLADAYRDGDGVVPNEASTVALRQRVQELCAYRRNQAFCEELAAR